MTNKYEPLILKGTAYWPKIKEGQQNESGDFSLDLSVDKDTKAKLKAMKISIKNKDVQDADFNRENPDRERPLRGDFITAKSKFPPAVVGSDKKEMLDILGNGSEVNIIVQPYDWDNKKGKKGTSLGLRKIQVTKLVKYEKKDHQALDFDDLGPNNGNEIPF